MYPGPVSQNYLMTRICHKIKIFHKISSKLLHKTVISYDDYVKVGLNLMTIKYIQQTLYTTPNAGESTKSKGESIPTYEGVDFPRFGDVSNLGNTFFRYL